jgi:hypothetical protein
LSPSMESLSLLPLGAVHGLVVHLVN